MTENTEQYNGWTNRETWAASLYLNNDEGLYSMARECESPEALEEMIEELKDEREGNKLLTMMFDEIGSLWRVNWQEVWEGLQDE